MIDPRVDAYTATVQDEGNEALAWVCEAVPVREQILVGREGGINRWKYEHGVAVLDGKTTVACVRWGGNGGGVSIELKGSVAHETYGLLRARYQDHACSRLDLAIDRTAPGLFDLAHRNLLAIASSNNPRISTEPAGKGWDQPGVYGRTKYFGTRDSEAHAILYEKGFERRDRAGIDPATVDLDWTRFELSIHPSKKIHKLTLAGLTPLQAVGWSGWMRTMTEYFAGIDAARVSLPKVASDDDKTYDALITQYGAWVAKKSAQNPQFLETLLHDMQQRQLSRAGKLQRAMSTRSAA